jgi:hypothetical protein
MINNPMSSKKTMARSGHFTFECEGLECCGRAFQEYDFYADDAEITLDCPICHRRRLKIREDHDG